MRMKLNQFAFLTLSLTLLLNSPATLWGQTSASQPVTSSGTEFMAPKTEVNGKLIGQEEALIQEVVITDSGRQYHRLDVGVSGTLEGWVVKEGRRTNHFASDPQFTFSQSGNENRRFHGILRYEASKGTAVTIIYPEDGTVWNRKLFVTVHGSGGSFLAGTLKPWNKNFDPSDPLGDISGFERVMLDKGYAIAKTRRNAGSTTGTTTSGLGDYPVTLDDGEVVEGRNLNIHTSLMLDFIRLAENLVKARLGEKPVRTYWYGHSAGGMNGRLMNYVPGLNINENGELIIDGFLNHDTGGGMFLPVLMEEGKDILLVTDKERQQLVKTIEVIHPLGPGDGRGRSSVAQWVSPVSLVNKRMNPKILIDKGLGDKIRLYEVQGVSHFPGGYYSSRQLASRGIWRETDVVLLDLTGLLDGLIDLLDNWVEKDIAPPATRSDWLELGDVDSDGLNENEAIALPEVACPLGVYYRFPPSMGAGGGQFTGFAPFDGQGLEPQDGRGVFVDMDLDRYLGYRESVDQAWHRLGLLKPGEEFSRSKYQACVEDVVGKLKQEKLITERVAARYIQETSVANFPGQ